MAAEFDFSVPPFDSLTPGERGKVAAALDIAYFPQMAMVAGAGEAAIHLHVIVKGIVDERTKDAIVNVFAEQDSFDGAALIEGRYRNSYVAQEETICYLLPRATFLDLLRANTTFSAYYTESVAARVAAQAGREASRRAASFLVARVRDVSIDAPTYVPPETSLRTCAEVMRERKFHTLLVRDSERTGLVTRTDLGNAVLLQGLGPDSPVGPIAHYDMITIDAGDRVSNAMAAFARHGIRRLIVKDGAALAGVLELATVLSFLSDNSHLVSVHIARARTWEELKAAAREIDALVSTLHESGARPASIAALVTELNRALIRKAFESVAPAELRARACLCVMGSEGRGEQILKTDQDNLLILPDDSLAAAARDAGAALEGALLDLGYPPCPGRMMVSNPAWTKTLEAFRADVRLWIASPGDDSYLNLAALFDAAPIAGDASLVEALRGDLVAHARGNDAFLANFARPVQSFETPRVIVPQILIGLTDLGRGLDIKKAAIFPIVHGARCFALELGLDPRGTLDRIDALVERNIVDARLAGDLKEAFQFTLGLRLRQQLARLGSGQSQAEADLHNRVDLESIGRMELQLLRDALQVVIEFKRIVAHHFRLGLF